MAESQSTSEEILSSSNAEVESQTNDEYTPSQMSLSNAKASKEASKDSKASFLKVKPKSLKCCRNLTTEGSFYFSRDTTLEPPPAASSFRSRQETLVPKPSKVPVKPFVCKSVQTARKHGHQNLNASGFDGKSQGLMSNLSQPKENTQPPYLNVYPEDGIKLTGPFERPFKFDIGLENTTKFPVHYGISIKDSPFKMIVAESEGVVLPEDGSTVCVSVFPWYMYAAEEIETEEYFFTIREEIRSDECDLEKSSSELKIEVTYNSDDAISDVMNISGTVELEFRRAKVIHIMLTLIIIFLLIITLCLGYYYFAKKKKKSKKSKFKRRK